jgi:hypothetical protein
MAEEWRPTWKKSKGEIGREYNQELADEIIKRMNDGEDLAVICKLPHMPKIRAVTVWRKENKDFDRAFLKAFHVAAGTDCAPVVRGRGRPTIRTVEIEEELIARLEDGELLAQICRLDYMPKQSTVYSWAHEDPDFAVRVARARQLGVQSIQADCIDIADDGSNDYYEKQSRKTGETFVALDAENIQRSRLRIETRKWLVGTIDPRMRENPSVKINVNTPEVGSIAIGQDEPSSNDPRAAFEEYQKLIKGE